MADYIKEHYNFPLTQKSENKPLKGVRVIDAGNMVAAPFATVLLAAALALPGLRLTHGALSFGSAVHTALACDPASSSSCGG